MAEQRLSACAEQVRRNDPDRFLTTLFAPAQAREDLFALYALNDELARAAEAASEPLVGAMRLQWWRDALDAVAAGRPPRHPVAEALAAARPAWPAARLAALADARDQDMAETPPADMKALEAYVEATAGALAALALDRLGVADARARQAGHHAAIAYGLAGVIRSVPAHAARGCVLLPGNVMAEARLAPAAIGHKDARPALAGVVASVAELAWAHDEAARRVAPPRRRDALPVLLWATLARVDLARLRRAGHDPFAPSLARPAPLRRVVVSWRAVRGRF